jgi:hypothetical protein
MLMRKTPQQGAIWHSSEPLGICGPSRLSKKTQFLVSDRDTVRIRRKTLPTTMMALNLDFEPLRQYVRTKRESAKGIVTLTPSNLRAELNRLREVLQTLKLLRLTSLSRAYIYRSSTLSSAFGPPSHGFTRATSDQPRFPHLQPSYDYGVYDFLPGLPANNEMAQPVEPGVLETCGVKQPPSG